LKKYWISTPEEDECYVVIASSAVVMESGVLIFWKGQDIVASFKSWNYFMDDQTADLG
jgi:hypothetical protein